MASTKSTAPRLFFAFRRAVTEGVENACVFQMMPLRRARAQSHATQATAPRSTHPRLFRSFLTIAIRQAAVARIAAGAGLEHLFALVGSCLHGNLRPFRCRNITMILTFCAL